MTMTQTGQSSKKEKKVAKILYICIGLAVIIGILISVSMGTKKSLSPYKVEDSANEKSPDQPPAQ